MSIGVIHNTKKVKTHTLFIILVSFLINKAELTNIPIEVIKCVREIVTNIDIANAKIVSNK